MEESITTLIDESATMHVIPLHSAWYIVNLNNMWLSAPIITKYCFTAQLNVAQETLRVRKII